VIGLANRGTEELTDIPFSQHPANGEADAERFRATVNSIHFYDCSL
jgi:hypothetical protein